MSKEKESHEREGADSAMATIVKRILKDLESGAGDVVTNSRIINVFKKKISIIQTAFKKASKLGGSTLKRLVNKWKTGPKYSFKVFYNEVDVIKLKSQYEALQGEKRELEDAVTEETVKRRRLEEKLQSALEKAGKREEYYKKTV